MEHQLILMEYRLIPMGHRLRRLMEHQLRLTKWRLYLMTHRPAIEADSTFVDK